MRPTTVLVLSALALGACSKPKERTEPSSPPSVDARADQERAKLSDHLQQIASTRPTRFTFQDDMFGEGGLGLTGIGEGAGRPESVGLGPIGTIGHPSGAGSRTKPPKVRMGATSVTGRLPPEVIQRIVRMNFGRFRLCYEDALKNEPKLEGTIRVDFTIKNDGMVGEIGGSDAFPSASMAACVRRAFTNLSFPPPQEGIVKVSYPIAFSLPDPTVWKLLGKLVADVTADDVKLALERTGCTEVVRQELPPGTFVPVVFTAKKDGHAVTITFVGAHDPALPEASVKRLESECVVRNDGGFLLAVKIDGDADQKNATSLIDALVVSS